jgi:hypothetical protein
MPLLFYALDNVSGTMNLGNLGGEDRYTAQWINGGGYFDCSWGSNDPNSKRPKLMRLVPSENPWLQIVHNISLNISNGYTTMIWFKKADPTTPAIPLLDGMNGANSVTWCMWIWSTATQLDYDPGGAPLLHSDTLYTTSWNNMAGQESANSYSTYVNGTQVVSASLPVGTRVFGDRLFIGRRACAGTYLDGYVW